MQSKILACLSIASVGFASLLHTAPRPVAGRPAPEPEAAAVPTADCPLPADHFVPGETCAMCHSAAETANALWSATGDDVSPHGLWKATMMANSFRDPYWRAQVRKEVAAAGSDEKRTEIEALCITCHGPAAHHEARLDGEPSPGVFASADDPIARDGVTCTVCHKTKADGLGEARSFGGNLTIGKDKEIYGPYENPSAMPMRMHTGYVATHGKHVREAGLCGSCHTLYTHHIPGGAPFPEQTPYLEWRNSRFNAERDDAGDEARTCQQCHMPELGPMRIARNPGGRDFNIPLRDSYRGHSFVGGNAFMLDLLRRNREELGVEADAKSLERSARATRSMLSQRTAQLEIREATREGGRVRFEVDVTNKTGHKLPTGYPARRAWLRVQVRAGRTVVFESGAYDAEGRIRGVDDAGDGAGSGFQPHHGRITSADQVQIYEMIAADAAGEPTTYLTQMASVLKDNRLLPAGWATDGPHVADIAPKGVGEDAEYTTASSGNGKDVVRFDLKLPDDAGAGRLVVVAWLLYQTVPPRWVEPLRGIESEETERFVRMYDAADKAPETLGVTVAIVE